MRKTDPTIAAGVTWLDEHYPGWRQAVRVEALDMRHAACCVLGQLEGDYWRAKGAHRLTDEQAVALGFAAPVGDVPAWDAIQDAWEAELREVPGA